MPDYRRYFVPGGTFFFTVVTAGREPLFHSAAARKLLGDIIRRKCAESPFTTVAIVLMPDHLHALWTLPPGDEDYPGRWKSIKAEFTAQWLAMGGCECTVSAGYRRQRRRGVWQPRFIEHTIRDDLDLHNHANYIHFNPVKHGYARRPLDWRWSTFQRYVASGDYAENWGAQDQPFPDFGGINEDLLE